MAGLVQGICRDMSLTHILKWSFFSELAAKAIQPLVFIILSHMLTPEDFGVMTAAMMVIAFSQIFWEAGMGKALIQRNTDIKEASNAAFFINIALSIVIASGLYLFAESIAHTFFQDNRVTAVVQVMTAYVLLSAFSSVQTALLQKEMNFKKLFWVRFATISLPGLVSIPLARNGMGYWALVAGAIIGQLAQAVMLWWMSSWRPNLKTNGRVTKEIAEFGGWVGLTSFFSWLSQWVDILIIGIFFTVKDLGIFRIGNVFAVTLLSLAFSFLMPVLYSKFSKDAATSSKDDISRTLNLIFQVVAIISLPAGLLIFFSSGLIEGFLFSSNWKGVGYIIGLIAIKEAALWIFAFNVEAARAIGRPKAETFVAILSGLANVFVLYTFAHWGFDLFIIGRSLILMIFGLLIHLSVYLYIFGFSDETYKKLTIIIIAYLTLFSFIFLIKNLTTVTPVVNISIIAMIILFSGAIVYFNKAALRSIRKHWKNEF